MPVTPTSLILVAVINSLRDFEIARLLGWYRIPLRSAPKVIDVDYLAFYQTGAFGREKWRINHVAEVSGHELTTRGELLRDEPDHPHARHEYFKVQLGPLQALTQPIPAGKWRRITFFTPPVSISCMPAALTSWWWRRQQGPVCGGRCVSGALPGPPTRPNLRRSINWTRLF